MIYGFASVALTVLELERVQDAYHGFGLSEVSVCVRLHLLRCILRVRGPIYASIIALQSYGSQRSNDIWVC